MTDRSSQLRPAGFIRDGDGHRASCAVTLHPQTESRNSGVEQRGAVKEEYPCLLYTVNLKGADEQLLQSAASSRSPPLPVP